MKYIFIILACLSWFYNTAQISNVYKGGSGDGFNQKNSSEKSLTISAGGSGSGNSFNHYNESEIKIWYGGKSDGYSLNSYKENNINLFKGSSGDGWATINYTQPIQNIFSGGIGDGYADSNFTQSIQSIFSGGEGDGWASTYLPYQLLPVNILSFNAEKYRDVYSKLYWTTASEVNADHFVIERATDAVHFEPIGTVKAVGNSTALQHYTLVDSNPLINFNYYRIRQVDRDGKFSFTPARMVRFDINSDRIAVYPNPAHDWITIKLPEQQRVQKTIINIIAFSGAVVGHITVAADSGRFIRYNVSRLPKAAYTIHINSGTYQAMSQIIVQ